MGGVRTVEDDDARLQPEPIGCLRVHIERAPRIATKTAGADPALLATTSQSAVDQGDTDPRDLGHSIGPDRDHRGRVLNPQELEMLFV